MKLSRLSARLALIALMGLAIPADAMAGDGPSELHLVMREKNWHHVPAPVGGDKPGGVSSGIGDIYDATATNQIGKIYLTFTNLAVENGKPTIMFATGIIRLSTGDLSVETVVDVAERDKAKALAYTVTGGTGAYANMSGHGVNRVETLPSYQEIWLRR